MDPDNLSPIVTAEPKPRGRLRWIAVLLGLGVLGWIWWHGGKVRRGTPNQASLRPASTTPPVLLETKPPGSNALPQEVKATVPHEVAPTNGANQDGRTQRVLEAQLALIAQGLSPGSLDGVIGPQTRAALRAFQLKEDLPTTGELDAATQGRLILTAPPFSDYQVTSNDLARLLPLGKTWLSKSQQERLDYETLLELVAEKSQAHPNLIRHLNPDLDWSNLTAGAMVKVPNAEFPLSQERAAFVKILLAERLLQAFDEETNLLAQFPCSIAQRVDKRPVGELHVEVTAANPNYTFNPEVFPESAEARELGRKLILPPGPNNPVGTVWIGLDRPGYGIHGTPRPEDVGRTESHGCFRLANWNAEYLFRLVKIGTPVFVEP